MPPESKIKTFLLSKADLEDIRQAKAIAPDGSNIKFQHIVELNAGAALYLGGVSKNLKEGFNIVFIIDLKSYFTRRG